MGFEFGGFRLDAARRRLFAPDGAAVELPSRAFDVLLFMVERPGQLLDKAAILKGVWASTVVEEGNLSQCVFALRRALGDTSEHRFIVTVPGRGYQFVAEIRKPEARVSPAMEEPASTHHAEIKRRPAWLIRGVAVLALAALSAWLFWPSSVVPTTIATSAPGAAPGTIAVLPFADLSPTRDMEYLADGIAEELMNRLSKSGHLQVVGRRSAFSFKGKNADARTIGERLNVESILEGSVRKSGERLRISAQLVRARDGFNLWSETYDRELDDILVLQDTIAKEVSAALAPVIASGTKTANVGIPRTRIPDAYTAYLRGVYIYNRGTYEALPRARDEFLRAVQLDPKFALGHAWLGRCYSNIARTALGDATENRRLGMAASDRAIELEPQLADLWWVRMPPTNIETVPLSVRASIFERALAATPNDATAMLPLASVYRRLGRRDEALDLNARARKIEPLWPPALLNDAVGNYQYRGDTKYALDLLLQVEAIAPENPGPANLRATIAFSEGRGLEWDRWKAKAIETAPRDIPLHGYLSLDYSRLGIFDAAMYHARVSHELNPETAAGAFNIAFAHLFSGELDAARLVVRRAMVEHPDDFLAQLAQAELQYFSGDCAGAIQSIQQASPALAQPLGSIDLLTDTIHAAALVWCLRKQGNATRVDELYRTFKLQYAPPLAPGLFENLKARMAAAAGDRPALVANLKALIETKSMEFAFVRHEPLIQPWLTDPEVAQLLSKLEARNAEWRRVLPKSSMRVPIPGINVRDGAS